MAKTREITSRKKKRYKFKCGIYVIGGVGNHKNVLKSCERYNLNSNKWSSIPCLNISRAGASATCFNEREIFAFGGANKMNAFDSIERYYIREESWSLIYLKLKMRLRRFASIQISQRAILILGGEANKECFYFGKQKQEYILMINRC
jgi:hypothetical protein